MKIVHTFALRFKESAICLCDTKTVKKRIFSKGIFVYSE